MRSLSADGIRGMDFLLDSVLIQSVQFCAGDGKVCPAGILNGILVVRSAESCIKMLYELLTNTIDTELKFEGQNYRLVEKHTGSTLRVISRNKLLTNAFWTQYFR